METLEANVEANQDKIRALKQSNRQLSGRLTRSARTRRVQGTSVDEELAAAHQKALLLKGQYDKLVQQRRSKVRHL